ncbi:MAG: carboxypeptidase-like regulatory domain-containing protein [Planctomycetota bacterium]|nr:carboxypeptidase-like regulatory domain-containing protein [Planctomycetota bacterium]
MPLTRFDRAALPTTRLAGFLFAILVGATLVVAQQREPVRGSVVAADGQPWAGAAVVLLSRPLPDDERFGEADELHATSDAKGRFEVILLPGRRYVAWASAELPEDRYLASHPVDDVRAGRPLELVADAPRPHAIAQVEGLDAWRPHGAILCTLLSSTAVRILIPCVERDGKLVLPAFPGRRAALEVRCGARVLMPWAEAIDLTSADRQTIRVQPPRAVRFRCVDATKRPVAGIVFCACDLHGRHATEVARSDADGMLVPLLPLLATRFDWGNYPMMLLGADRAPRSWIATLKIPADHDAAKSPPIAEFVVADGRHLQSRVTLDGAAVGAGTLRVVSSMSPADRNEGTHDVTRCVPLAKDGGFAVDVDPQEAAVLTVFLPAELLARLHPARGFPLHPEVLLAALSPDDAATALPERLELQQLVPLDVQVLGPDGTPADSSLVGIAAPLPRLHRTLVASTDRSGRVRLLLPRDQKLVLCCWSEHGWCHADVDTSTVTQPLRPRLQPCQRLSGRVVEGMGKGNPAAWAEVTFFTGNDSADPAGALANCLAHHVRVRTDAGGHFDLPLYPGLRYSLSAVATPDDTHYPKAPEFTVGKDAPDELVIDLSVRR